MDSESLPGRCLNPKCVTPSQTKTFAGRSRGIFWVTLLQRYELQSGKRSRGSLRNKAKMQSEKMQRINASDRENEASELTVTDRRGCLSELYPHPCLVLEGTQLQQHPLGTAPMKWSSCLCLLSLPLWQLVSNVGHLPQQATLHFHNWGLCQGNGCCRHYGLRGMPRAVHAVMTPCTCEGAECHKAPAALGGFPV